MENSPQREGGSRPIKTCKSLLLLSLSLAGNARKEGVFVVIKATRVGKFVSTRVPLFLNFFGIFENFRNTKSWGKILCVEYNHNGPAKRKKNSNNDDYARVTSCQITREVVNLFSHASQSCGFSRLRECACGLSNDERRIAKNSSREHRRARVTPRSQSALSSASPTDRFL